jgi:hypothetical protein
VNTYATPPLEQSSALHRTASCITALSPIFCMHAPGCCDSQTVPPIQLDPAAFVASSDAMACMACSSYTSTGTFVMLYSTQRAHAVGVYICSRRRPKHKDDLHFAPIKNTRTPAKPRIQYVQNPASFCCRMPPCWTLHASLAAVSQHNKSNKMLHIETPRLDSEFGNLPAGILLIALVT